MTPEQAELLTRPVETLDDIAHLYGVRPPRSVVAMVAPARVTAAVPAPPSPQILSDDEIYDQLFGS